MILSIAYVVLGFMMVRWLVVLFNFVTRPLLPVNKSVNSIPEQISLLIPARNEEHNLKILLATLIENNTSIFKEVLILDDHSTDNTAALVSEFSKQDPKIKLLKGSDLPTGWLGKNWACHQLALAATGSYLLFIDADTSLSKEVVPYALNRLQTLKLALLSLFPDQQMKSVGEKMTVPLMHYFLLTLLPLRLVKSTSEPSLSAANGQFMLFDANTYKKFEFHKLVKDNILEDVNIMRLVKKNGLKGEVLLANGTMICRMYRSGREAINGFGKNFFLGFNKNIPAFLIYLFFILPGWIFVFLSFNPALIITYTTLILTIRLMVSVLSNQSVSFNFFMHPLQAMVFAYIGIYSLYIHLTGKVEWKGRKIS